MTTYVHYDPTLRPHYVRVYAAIREAIMDYGESPSMSELQHACLISSTTVIQAVRELRKRGYIEHQKFKPRSLAVTDIDREIRRDEPDPWNFDPPERFWQPRT